MKLFLKIVCIVFITISVASCNKDSSSASVKMGASIDGKSWNSSVRVAVLQGNIFTITGTSLTGEIIAITINGETTGAYSLSLLPPVAGCAASYKASYTTSTADIWGSITGKVVLTKVDKTNKLISGTFEFSLALPVISLVTKSITQGQFNDLQYQ